MRAEYFDANNLLCIFTEIIKIMGQFNFRIAEGLRATSGEILLKGIGIRALKTRAFRPAQGISVDRDDQFQDFEILGEKDEEQFLANFKSLLGTPVFDPIIFPAGQFNELGNVIGPPQPFDQLIIPSVIIEVSQTKNIITTAIQGRNGTVKEFVSDGDFAITLTGVLVGQNEGNKIIDIGNAYPDDDVKKLITICKVPDTLTLTSKFLNDVFGINQVVITDYNIPQREATRNMQPFQISMLSDISIDLEELT